MTLAAEHTNELLTFQVAPITEIVLPLDGEPNSLRAAPLAEEMAQRAGVPLVAMSVVADPTTHGHHARELQRSLDRIGITPQRLEVHGGTSFVSTLTAELLPGSVVCMTASATATAAEVAFGSTTTDVVEHTQHPTLIVGPHTDLLRCRRIRRLVLAVDGDDSSLLAATAVVWARTLHLDVTVVEVVQPSTLPPDVNESGHVHAIAEQIHRAVPEINVDFDVLHDRHVDRALLGYARDVPGAMIAVATSGLDASNGLRMTSTSRRVLAHTDVPLLVVHQPVGTSTNRTSVR